jgi:hypothetical protein
VPNEKFEYKPQPKQREYEAGDIPAKREAFQTKVERTRLPMITPNVATTTV